MCLNVVLGYFSDCSSCTKAIPATLNVAHDAQVLERRLIRIAEEIKTAVTAEVDRIAAAGMPASTKTGWAQLTEAFPTADQLLDEIQVHGHDAPCLPYTSLSVPAGATLHSVNCEAVSYCTV